MAKVYGLAEELVKELPVVDYKNYDRKKEEAQEQEFLDKVKAFCVKHNPNDKLAGVEYSIQHADGYARYAVLSSKPVKLMHLPLGDAWDSPWADRVTKKDIEQEVKSSGDLKSMFATM